MACTLVTVFTLIQQCFVEISYDRLTPSSVLDGSRVGQKISMDVLID